MAVCSFKTRHRSKISMASVMKHYEIEAFSHPLKKTWPLAGWQSSYADHLKMLAGSDVTAVSSSSLRDWDLAIALHGLFCSQDEWSEAGQGFGQLQEWMLQKDKEIHICNITLEMHFIFRINTSFQQRFNSLFKQKKNLCSTCSSSWPDPRFSTSISRQRDKKDLKTGDSFSGLCSSGVPLVAIK